MVTRRITVEAPGLTGESSAETGGGRPHTPTTDVGGTLGLRVPRWSVPGLGCGGDGSGTSGSGSGWSRGRWSGVVTVTRVTTPTPSLQPLHAPSSALETTTSIALGTLEVVKVTLVVDVEAEEKSPVRFPRRPMAGHVRLNGRPLFRIDPERSKVVTTPGLRRDGLAGVGEVVHARGARSDEWGRMGRCT